MASEGPTPVRLDLLGGFPLSIEAEDVPLPLNAQRLVAFLALNDRPLRRTFVHGSLWGGANERGASGSLRSALWRLQHPTYTLVALTNERLELSPTVSVDIREGEALAHRVLDPSQELDGVADANEEVLTADLLPDWTEDWVLLEREKYQQLRLRALEALCRRLTAQGRLGQAVQAGLLAVSGERACSAHRSSYRRATSPQRSANTKRSVDYSTTSWRFGRPPTSVPWSIDRRPERADRRRIADRSVSAVTSP